MNNQKTKKILIENPMVISIFIAVIYFGTFGFLSNYDFTGWAYAPFVKSVIGVFLGAGAIGIITGVIIMFQSSLESRKEKAKEIFDQKINLYKNVIDNVNDMFIDGKINEIEFRKIELMLLKLQLMAKDETIETFVVFYKKVAEMIPTDTDGDGELEFDIDIELKNIFSSFVNQCRTDLELSDQKLNPEIFTEIRTIQQQANQNLEMVRFKPSNGLTVANLVSEALKSLHKKNIEIVNKKLVHEEIENLHPGEGQPAAATVGCKLMAYTSINSPHPTKERYKRDVSHQGSDKYDWLNFNNKKFSINKDSNIVED
jgi:gas vesicle protein